MSRTLMIAPRVQVVGAALVLGASLALSAISQIAPAGAQPAAAPPAGISPARQAVEARKAVFVLIGNNFKPLGDVLKGAAPYDAAEAQKRVARIAFLAELLNDAFPDVSNLGEPETKTKADAWANRADFEKKLKAFQTDANALIQVNFKERGATEAFKTAIAAVGQDCKACHDAYRVK